MSHEFDPWRSMTTAADVVAMSHATPERLAAAQARRLTALLAAARRAPLHAARLAALPDDAPLADLPAMDKALLMARFDDALTEGDVDLASARAFVRDPARVGWPMNGRYAVWESSGSSGNPGLFVHDPAALAVYDALEALRPGWTDPRASWMGVAPGARMAFVGAIDGHFASFASVQRLRRLNPWMAPMLRSFSILQPLPDLLAQLDAWQPTRLATYPTAAALLASCQRQGLMRLRLSQLMTGGETLGAAQREAIASAFGCPVRNSYGASEFLTIAAECAHEALHVNADWVILEAVDAGLQPVPEGELSHTTLLTNLANHVQPLLRYDLGDRVRFVPGRCACGSRLPVIEVEGRQDDALHLRGARGQWVTLLPMALSTVLEDEAGVFDFQLCQHDARTLVLRLGAGEQADCWARCSEVLRRYAMQQGADALRLRHDPDTPPQRGRSGKVQRVVAHAGIKPGSAERPLRRRRGAAG
ncbi:MAG TPA: phenylacetate--CoA ligase family protein [Rubrivivax sp.]|nr:phenylacetate--CoA ligase family protein [Burkholderiales bacterium]HNT38059.1 phenylacetate--CoA ligase family protein [Rubrivivax sp.]